MEPLSGGSRSPSDKGGPVCKKIFSALGASFWSKNKGGPGPPGPSPGSATASPQSFWYVAVFRSDFAFTEKPLIFLTRWGIFYEWWRCWRPVTSTTMTWPPATYYVIPRDHRNWSSLNLSQNACEGKRLSTENVRCWCFILSEKSQKNLRGVASTPPPHSLYVRELKCYFFEKGKYDKGHACYSQNIAGIDVQPVTPPSFSLRII